MANVVGASLVEGHPEDQEMIARMRKELSERPTMSEFSHLKVDYELLKGELAETKKRVKKLEKGEANSKKAYDLLLSEKDKVFQVLEEIQRTLADSVQVQGRLEDEAKIKDAENASLKDQIAQLKMEAANIIPDYLQSDALSSYDANNKFCFVRAYVKKLAAKLPAHRQLLIEYTKVFLEQYFREYYVEDPENLEEVANYPPEKPEEDAGLMADCSEFDALPPALD